MELEQETVELLPSGDGEDMSGIPIVDSIVPSADFSLPDASDVTEVAAIPMNISIVESPSFVEEVSTKAFRYPNSGGNFYTGIDITSEEAVRKREARMKRFGLGGVSMLEEPNPEDSVERRKVRAKRFGTKLVAAKGEPVKLMHSLPHIPDAEVRPEALLLHGTSEMSTRDVFSYFKLYSPRNIEWVNDNSCNVVWEDRNSTSRALLGLGRQPVALSSQYESETVAATTTTGTKNHTDDRNQTEGDLEDRNQIMSSEQSRVDQEPQQDQIQSASLDSVCEEGEEGEKESLMLQWRYGQSHPNAKQLLLRYATKLDVKEKGAAKNSTYYKKYGRPPMPSTREKVGEEEDKVESEQPQQDLRSRIGQKHSRRPEDDEDDDDDMEYESEEDMEVRMVDSPFASLAKRPRPLYSDRPNDQLDVTEMMDESEKQRRLAELGAGGGEVGLGGGRGDLRRALQQKKKRRNLKLRIGHNPRLVEERL